MSTWFLVLCQFSILTFAILCGVFLAFSDFIMRSLQNTGASGGIEAMQIINREVFHYIFMTLFLLMAPVSIVIAGYAVMNLTGSAATLLLLAAVVYLLAAFGVTLLFNVPLNEALADMDTATDATQAYWNDTYLPRWTYWNTVRTAACALASALLLVGLSQLQSIA